MSWEWGVNRLPDGTYVDRPRPSRWLLPGVGILLVIVWAPVLLFDPQSSISVPRPLAMLLSLAGAVAMLSNAYRIEYRVDVEHLIVRTPFFRRTVERGRIDDIRRAGYDAYLHLWTNRWTDTVVVKRGWGVFNRLHLSPTEPVEFIAELQRRPFGGQTVSADDSAASR